MYSKEERKKAVDLYIQYDKQLSKTIKTLGYPHHVIPWENGTMSLGMGVSLNTKLLESQNILKSKNKKLLSIILIIELMYILILSFTMKIKINKGSCKNLSKTSNILAIW